MRNPDLKQPLLLAALSITLAGCAPAAKGPSAALSGPDIPYTQADFGRIPKIDAHVHANMYDPSFLALVRDNGFQVLSINVDYPDFPSLDGQAEVAHRYFAEDAGLFQFTTTFSMDGFETAGWSSRTNAHIDRELAAGAIGVKVWKNIGMVERNREGELVMLDDPGFDTVMAHIEQRGVPLIAHQAEPYNCWLPLDQMTTENDRLYFQAHPEYHMYLHPEMPSYRELRDARDRFVEAHPGLTLIGAHLGSIEWSVDELATFLDAHPNAVVDMAARMSNLQYQSNRDRDRVRDFLIKYQDRVLYATDLTLSPLSDAAKAQNPPIDPGADFAQAAEEVWRSDWTYLATPESQYVDTLKADTPGLALPRSVIRKIYYENALRVFPAFAQAS